MIARSLARKGRHVRFNANARCNSSSVWNWKVEQNLDGKGMAISRQKQISYRWRRKEYCCKEDCRGCPEGRIRKDIGTFSNLGCRHPVVGIVIRERVAFEKGGSKKVR